VWKSGFNPTGDVKLEQRLLTEIGRIEFPALIEDLNWESAKDNFHNSSFCIEKFYHPDKEMLYF
jgi:hypothetical protein